MPLFFVQLLIGLATSAFGYLLMPKPKATQPEETVDFEEPTAEEGRSIPVIFGTVRISGLNVLFAADKEIIEREVPVEGAK